MLDSQLENDGAHSLGMALVNIPSVTSLPVEEPDYLRILSEIDGEVLEPPDYLKLLHDSE